MQSFNRYSLLVNSAYHRHLRRAQNALNAWKAGWKRTPGSSIDPQNPAGPIAFTSTALLGLAYIRLHLDLGPCRRLVTQDPLQIARALQESPPIVRSPKLIMALLHSAHALSIPVAFAVLRLGNSLMILCLSATVKPLQPVISAIVRWQPVQRPSGLSWQT